MPQRLRRFRLAPPGPRWLLPLVLLAAGMSAIAGGPVGAAASLLCIAAATAFARLLVDAPERREVLSWIVAVCGVRVIAAAALHLLLLQRSPYGNLFLDDAGYVQIGIALADFWHGRGLPPFIDPSFDHNYIKTAGGVFFIAGPNVLALKLLNTFFGVAGAIIVLRIARAARIRGGLIAFGIALVFPSLVLWSALALKDSFANFFCLLAVWSVTEFGRTRQSRWFVLTVAALLVLENVRAFLFVILAVSWPIGLFIALPSRRLLPAATAGGVAALLLVSTSALNYLNPNIVTGSVYVRQAMARGAVSGFVAPLPVIRAEPCAQFVVTVPGRTSVPSPRQIDVPVGSELVVDTSTTTAGSGQVVVRPGDLVAVAGATPCPVAAVATPTPSPVPGTPRPGSTPSPTEPAAASTPTMPSVVVIADARNVVSTPAPQTQDSFAFSRDILVLAMHFPIGFAALVAAPFPPLSRSLGELATTPEMLSWYALLAFALVGAIRIDAKSRARMAYALIVGALLAVVLTLYEGNLGTLVRHRAMVIPFVILLAGVGAAHLRRAPSD